VRDPATNRILSETDALGRLTTYQYDELGNVAQRTLLAGTSSAATWSYTYQAEFNRVLTATDPLGNTTYMQYDSLGNLIQVTDL
jgi:YD repeat-containing protein